jgi:hypothetical protein
MTSAQRIDEHVGGLQVRGGFGMLRPPTLEPGQRVGFVAGDANLDERQFRDPAA